MKKEKIIPIIIGCLLGFLIANYCLADTLQENYNTGYDAEASLYGSDVWQAQTFTITEEHDITKVNLRLRKSSGGTAGDLTIEIQGVDGSNKPDGVTLVSGTTDSNVFTDASNGLFYEISFNSTTTLIQDATYSIVAKLLGGDTNNRVYWKVDSEDPLYGGGARNYTSDGGSSWTTQVLQDFMFEEYGAEYPTSTPPEYPATSTDVVCSFFNPQNASGSIPLFGEYWQFASSSCAVPFISNISDGSGTDFYLDKRISYGDVWLLIFILMFVIMKIFSIIWNFFVPKMIKALTKNDL